MTIKNFDELIYFLKKNQDDIIGASVDLSRKNNPTLKSSIIKELRFSFRQIMIIYSNPIMNRYRHNEEHSFTFNKGSYIEDYELIDPVDDSRCSLKECLVYARRLEKLENI
jgi:hypothetical protein